MIYFSENCQQICGKVRLTQKLFQFLTFLYPKILLEVGSSQTRSSTRTPSCDLLLRRSPNMQSFSFSISRTMHILNTIIKLQVGKTIIMNKSILIKVNTTPTSKRKSKCHQRLENQDQNLVLDDKVPIYLLRCTE